MTAFVSARDYQYNDYVKALADTDSDMIVFVFYLKAESEPVRLRLENDYEDGAGKEVFVWKFLEMDYYAFYDGMLREFERNLEAHIQQNSQKSVSVRIPQAICFYRKKFWWTQALLGDAQPLEALIDSSLTQIGKSALFSGTKKVAVEPKTKPDDAKKAKDDKKAAAAQKAADNNEERSLVPLKAHVKKGK